jgi:hypothetical protein
LLDVEVVSPALVFCCVPLLSVSSPEPKVRPDCVAGGVLPGAGVVLGGAASGGGVELLAAGGGGVDDEAAGAPAGGEAVEGGGVDVEPVVLEDVAPVEEVGVGGSAFGGVPGGSFFQPSPVPGSDGTLTVGEPPEANCASWPPPSGRGSRNLATSTTPTRARNEQETTMPALFSRVIGRAPLLA